MKKLLVMFVLCVATLCWGQNANYQNIAVGTINSTSKILQAIPNATITVFNCAGGNCASLTPASLCTSITDATCNQSNTVTADVFGNFNFYIAPGRYAYTVQATGFNTLTYTDVIINAATGDPGGPTSYPLQVNATPLVNGDTINFNNSTPVAPTNGINVTWSESLLSGVYSVSAAIVGDGNASDCFLGTGVFATCPGSGGSLTGSGTTGYIPKWTGSTALGNSPYNDEGSSGAYEEWGDSSASPRTLWNVGAALLNGSVTGSSTFNSNLQITQGNTTTACTTGTVNCNAVLVNHNPQPTATSTTDGYTAAFFRVGSAGGAASTTGTQIGIIGDSYGPQGTGTTNMFGVVGAAGCGNSSTVPFTSEAQCSSSSLTNSTAVTTQAGGYFLGVPRYAVTNNNALIASLSFPAASTPITATNSYGVHVLSPVFRNANNVATHLYGLYIEDQTVAGTGTNSDPWGIYEAGGKNQFTGIVNHVTGMQQNGTPLGIACGTTSSCAATAAPLTHVVFGSAPLVSGTPSTVTITGISPAFTSTSSYVCTVSNETTAADGLKWSAVSGSSITITGPNTVTDTVSYICTGT